MPEPSSGTTRKRGTKQRWECRCADPAILLAMYEPGGQVEIKLRDRFYLASGCVHATCPRCGTQHILDLRPSSDADDLCSAPEQARLIPPTGGSNNGGWF
ncbi:MAG TPA: hypothetical protein VEX37_04720 [Thermomicrobiales bacterium]|nr:hypothetical protein [Thermomicrobiales bacterium]